MVRSKPRIKSTKTKLLRVGLNGGLNGTNPTRRASTVPSSSLSTWATGLQSNRQRTAGWKRLNHANSTCSPHSHTLLTTKQEKLTGRGIATGKEILGATMQTLHSCSNPQLLVTVVFGRKRWLWTNNSATTNGALQAVKLLNGPRANKTLLSMWDLRRLTSLPCGISYLWPRLPRRVTKFSKLADLPLPRTSHRSIWFKDLTNSMKLKPLWKHCSLLLAFRTAWTLWPLGNCWMFRLMKLSLNLRHLMQLKSKMLTINW